MPRRPTCDRCLGALPALHRVMRTMGMTMTEIAAFTSTAARIMKLLEAADALPASPESKRYAQLAEFERRLGRLQYDAAMGYGGKRRVAAVARALDAFRAGTGTTADVERAFTARMGRR